jgi:hypothetical protein
VAARSLVTVPWRTGRSLGRTLYARTGGDDWKADTFIGIMETPELALAVAEWHNQKLGDLWRAS